MLIIMSDIPTMPPAYARTTGIYDRPITVRGRATVGLHRAVICRYSMRGFQMMAQSHAAWQSDKWLFSYLIAVKGCWSLEEDFMHTIRVLFSWHFFGLNSCLIYGLYY